MSDPDRPYFIPPGSGRLIDLFPGVSLRTTAGDGLMISIVSLEPGAVVPTHSHPHEQMGYLVSGRLEFTIGETTSILEPGSAWRIPPDVPHRVVALGGPALALDVFHPIREDYL
jgi:quercetin dioxygenase-like cupin family protein